MHNVLEFVLESTFKVLDLMLKHYFTRCLKKCLMLQAHLKVLVLVLQAPKSVLESNPASILSSVLLIITTIIILSKERTNTTMFN